MGLLLPAVTVATPLAVLLALALDCALGEPPALAAVQRADALVASSGAQVVLDRACEPLRLSGRCSLDDVALQRVWQLWTPNKALGLTGVRGACAIAPLHAVEDARALDRLAPSWVLGSHAVALLEAWVSPAAQDWLVQSRHTLALWKSELRVLLTELDWTVMPSEANYVCAAPPHALDAPALRTAGIKLRDTTSFGLPGHWRLGVLPPEAQAALRAALHRAEVMQ